MSSWDADKCTVFKLSPFSLSIPIYNPEMEFDLDKALEAVPVHLDDQAASSKLEKKASGAMGELPSEECKKLQHFTKLRPKRNKKTNSSKVPVGVMPEVLPSNR